MSKRSLSDLMIVLAEDPSKYGLSKTALGGHIPTGNPSNFDTKGRDIMILGTKSTPQFMPLLLNRELGHYILQDTTPEEMKRIFNIEKKSPLNPKDPQEALIHNYWSIFLIVPKLLTQDQQNFFKQKVSETGGGTPEITHELLLKKQGRIK